MAELDDVLGRLRAKHPTSADEVAPRGGEDPAIPNPPPPNGHHKTALDAVEAAQTHKARRLRKSAHRPAPRHSGAHYRALEARRFQWLARHMRELTGREIQLALYLVTHCGTRRGYGAPLSRLAAELDMQRPHVHRALARLCAIGMFNKRSTGAKKAAFYRWRVL